MSTPSLDIDLNLLRRFYEIVCAGSLTRAHEQSSYRISLPRLSQTRNELESQLRFAVFEPGRRLRLTEAGGRLFRVAEKALRAFDDALALIRNEQRPTLSLGGAAAFQRHFAYVMKGLTEAEPGLNPDVEALPEDLVVQRLVEGLIHIAILPLDHPLPRYFARSRLVALPLVLLVPKRSNIRQAEQLQATKQITWRVALPTTSSTLIAHVEKHLRRLGLLLGEVTSCSLDGVLQHVAAGDHIGVTLHEPSLTRHAEVRAIPLKTFGKVEIGAVWRAPGTAREKRVVGALKKRAAQCFGEFAA